MVGEIRDRETAEISVQAALTGHLVLSTIHTNSAAATVIRLRDMGIENYLLSSVLRGIVAQRLIRQLCDVCKTDYIAPPELSERLDLEARSGLCEYRLWRSVGCDHCRGTGYKGRRAIAEYMNISPIIQTLISGGSHENEIQAAAIGEGMIPIFQSGLSLALDGKTSIEEVTRSVTDEAGLQRKSNPKYLRSRKVILRRA